jgi:acyl-ACP thioesterase
MQNQAVTELISTSFNPANQDVDINKRLRLTSFLHKTQEAAEAHAFLYGCGHNHLIENNIAWVLSRMQIEIMRMPNWHEPVRLDTWHKRIERIFSLRDFILFDSKEHPIVLATSAWLLMDIHSRRMLRVEHVLPHLAQVHIHKDAIAAIPDKITAPDDISLHHVHTVRFSDIDLNNHVTNTKYVEWALDCLPLELLKNQTISSFQINFNLEALYNDPVELMYGTNNGQTHYIEGRRDGRNLFQCVCVF